MSGGYRASAAPPIVIARMPLGVRFRAWWRRTVVADVMVPFGLIAGMVALCGGIVGGVQACESRRAAAEPCARYVTGPVAVTDDIGRATFINHTWCLTYKAGRQPK